MWDPLLEGHREQCESYHAGPHGGPQSSCKDLYGENVHMVPIEALSRQREWMLSSVRPS